MVLSTGNGLETGRLQEGLDSFALVVTDLQYKPGTGFHAIGGQRNDRAIGRQPVNAAIKRV